jgi:uncharacterized protein involved in exopolysaccharide biosynthesis
MTTSLSPSPLTTTGRNALPPAGNPGGDWELLRVFVARWRLLLVLPIVFGAVGWLLTFLIPPTYTSTTTFVAASQRDIPASLGGFANVASQLGVGLPTNPTNSPQFYGDVLRSREVMINVLRTRVPDPRPNSRLDSTTIAELYVPHVQPPAIQINDAIKKLRRESAVNVNPRTNVIELNVNSRFPVGAMLVARQFLTALNRFNLETRQSQARERRRFLAARLQEAQDSLARAERVQLEFLEANRGNIRTVPTLDAQYERIQRQILTYQELYSNFRREFETARVDEINDTPVLTIIDTAAVPLKQSAPRRLLTAVAGAMFGIFVAIAVLLAHGYVERLRLHRPGDYNQLRELRRIFLRTLGIRHPNAA